ncbi:nuclear transport factor 2 family protein [Massilia polaris]|nr:nuclear transport factor 2 family protein [Massilia polaris]
MNKNMQSGSPIAAVQAQLDAFNARDIDALMAAYAPDAEQYQLHGDLLARGHEQMRPRFLLRFQEADLHARLISRTVMDNVVVDFEIITRNFPEGLGTIEMLCVYEVSGGRIQKASFASGRTTLARAQGASI